MPLVNTWALAAREAGVSREHALVPGFELRTLPFFQVQPRTALANAVDNTVRWESFKRYTFWLSIVYTDTKPRLVPLKRDSQYFS